jgi:iron complex transport system substrate-binding protein
MRIVSLLAGATEMVCALGAGDMLVGRSHECDNPEWVRSLPACSAPAFDVSVSSHAIDAEVKRRLRAGEPLYRIDTERIRLLKPDLIIAQAHCEVCAVTPGDVERGGCEPLAGEVLALTAGSLEGILESIGQIARAVGREREGVELVRRERERLDAVRAKTAGKGRPSVMMLEWTDPIFTMGNWAPELVEIAHGEPLAGKRGHSTGIAGERIPEADPDYLIIAPCGFGLERAWHERAVLEAYPWWRSLRAVQAGKAAFADGNLYFNRSGMTIARTAEILAEILHSVVSGTRTEGTCWRWYERSS